MEKTKRKNKQEEKYEKEDEKEKKNNICGLLLVMTENKKISILFQWKMKKIYFLIVVTIDLVFF